MIFNTNYFPKRIVCLTEETTELLYLLGEEERIVGISGFTMRPPEARKNKPKVSTFLDANIDEILELKPDLVIGFSDIQANIAKELISEGITVWVNNHRSIQGIFNMMVQLGALVGRKQASIDLVEQIRVKIFAIEKETSQWKNRPTVYFEEWYDPLISGIQWVSQIVEIAGGEDVFSNLSEESLAKGRIIKDPNLVVKKNPDIILVSWCGKKFKKQKMISRKGWNSISAVKSNCIYELESEIILQPGPAALMDGLNQIHDIFKNWTLNNE